VHAHVHTRRRRRRPLLAVAVVGTTAALTAALAPLVGARSQATPTNTTEPAISGTARAGETLATSNGTWTGSPTSFAYKWLRCDTAGASCTEIGGANGSSYRLTSDDVGRRVRARVAATNADGTASATANPTAVVAPPPDTGPPVNVKAPSISGTVQVGQQLRVSPGDWGGAQPISFDFRWLRCDAAGNSCFVISGATDEGYRVAEADQGRTLRARVSASNGSSTVNLLTAPTATVAPASGPDGAIKLSNGETSIPATSVPATERLIVDQVAFEPNVIRSRETPFTIKVKVKDTRGFVVRDALVFVRSTPLVTQRSEDRDAQTAQDGFATVVMRPERDFPQLNPAYAVQFFVKAYRQG